MRDWPNFTPGPARRDNLLHVIVPVRKCVERETSAALFEVATVQKPGHASLVSNWFENFLK